MDAHRGEYVFFSNVDAVASCVTLLLWQTEVQPCLSVAIGQGRSLISFSMRNPRLCFRPDEVRKTCIDGQQRVTTSCLVISAIRDAMLGALERAGAAEGDDDAAAGFELVARLETLLFLDPDKVCGLKRIA